MNELLLEALVISASSCSVLLDFLDASLPVTPHLFLFIRQLPLSISINLLPMFELVDTPYFTSSQLSQIHEGMIGE